VHDLRVLVGFVYRLVVAPYCVAAVGIVVAKLDRLHMCTLGHDVLSKCWSSVGTAQKYVEVSGEFTKLWAAGERWGDVGSFCGNYCPIISVLRKYQSSAGFEELPVPRPDSYHRFLWNTALRCSQPQGAVVHRIATRRKCL